MFLSFARASHSNRTTTRHPGILEVPDLITANNLYKSYGPAMVLGDMSFSLNRGDRVGLVGANGAGKSTLLTALPQFDL
jgi:ABC-type polysaccharide/polyol phosphate transport system ATPase subunit